MDRPCLVFVFLLWITRITVEANSSAVLQLLNSIKQQENYNYLLLIKYQNSTFSNKFLSETEDKCFVQSLMENLPTTVMQLDEHVNYFLYEKESNHVLSVIFLVGTNLTGNEILIKALVANLRLMTISRVVFMVQMSEINEIFLYKLFAYCWKLKLLNVLAIFENYQTTYTFYSYSPFPIFQLEQRIYDPNSVIYPDRLSNLRGYSVPIIIGGSTPRIIIYYNKHGNIVYRGTLGHFMDAFQQRYNCTLTQPILAKPNKLVPSAELVAAVLNGTVDISMAVTFPYLLNMRTFTYPYEQMHWCLMLPVEPDVPPAMYYLNVFQLQAFLLTLAVLIVISITLSSVLKHNGYDVQLYEFILHNNCLRGALGQSFHEVRSASIHVRATYIQICILGFLLTAWYNSYFSAYVTSTPKQLPYRSYDDVLASNVKVVAWESEYNELIGRLKEFRKYEGMFLVEPSFAKFISMRDSFNTEYGYMMTTTKWVVINEQQNIFSKPLFRMRDDFCFFKNVPLGFPVRENSIFKQPIQHLILEISATGLFQHWTSKGFLELVEAGELHFMDLSGRREFRSMQLQDLQYVWYGFGFMAMFSSSVWLLELFFNWLNVRRHKPT